MHADLSLNIHLNQTLFADPRRIALLEAIAETGSISQGAKLTGISYKTAWDAINQMNQLADQQVVGRHAGGKGGGGTYITAYGQRLLKLYHLLVQVQQKAFDVLQEENLPLDSLLAAIARFSLQTSARNQLFGTILAQQDDDLSERVTVLLSDRQTQVQVAITRHSSERLQLSPGKEVLVLIKAPWLEVSAAPSPYGNTFPVTLSQVLHGEHGCELLMTLSNGEQLCAALPAESADWRPGQSAWATFRPENALLASLN